MDPPGEYRYPGWVQIEPEIQDYQDPNETDWLGKNLGAVLQTPQPMYSLPGDGTLFVEPHGSGYLLEGPLPNTSTLMQNPEALLDIGRRLGGAMPIMKANTLQEFQTGKVPGSSSNMRTDILQSIAQHMAAQSSMQFLCTTTDKILSVEELPVSLILDPPEAAATELLASLQTLQQQHVRALASPAQPQQQQSASLGLLPLPQLLPMLSADVMVAAVGGKRINNTVVPLGQQVPHDPTLSGPCAACGITLEQLQQQRQQPHLTTADRRFNKLWMLWFPVPLGSQQGPGQQGPAGASRGLCYPCHLFCNSRNCGSLTQLQEQLVQQQWQQLVADEVLQAVEAAVKRISELTPRQQQLLAGPAAQRLLQELPPRRLWGVVRAAEAAAQPADWQRLLLATTAGQQMRLEIELADTVDAAAAVKHVTQLTPRQQQLLASPAGQQRLLELLQQGRLPWGVVRAAAAAAQPADWQQLLLSTPACQQLVADEVLEAVETAVSHVCELSALHLQLLASPAGQQRLQELLQQGRLPWHVVRAAAAAAQPADWQRRLLAMTAGQQLWAQIELADAVNAAFKRVVQLMPRQQQLLASPAGQQRLQELLQQGRLPWHVVRAAAAAAQPADWQRRLLATTAGQQLWAQIELADAVNAAFKRVVQLMPRQQQLLASPAGQQRLQELLQQGRLPWHVVRAAAAAAQPADWQRRLLATTAGQQQIELADAVDTAVWRVMQLTQRQQQLLASPVGQQRLTELPESILWGVVQEAAAAAQPADWQQLLLSTPAGQQQFELVGAVETAVWRVSELTLQQKQLLVCPAGQQRLTELPESILWGVMQEAAAAEPRSEWQRLLLSNPTAKQRYQSMQAAREEDG